MSFQVSITPTAQRGVDALRGKARKSFDAAVADRAGFASRLSRGRYADNTMRTDAEEAALAAFIDSATSDVDPGYPHGAAFVPWEQGTSTNRILERYLREGRPVVLVTGNGFELLVEPPSSAEVIAFALDQPVGGKRHTDPAMPRHLAGMIARGEVGPGNGARHSPKPARGREGGKSASEYVSEGRR